MSAPASSLCSQQVPSTKKAICCYYWFPSMRWTWSRGGDVPDSVGAVHFSRCCWGRALSDIWLKSVAICQRMTAADWVLVEALTFHYHWPSFTSKSRRQEVVKSCLGCGLSELIHRLPGAKTSTSGARRQQEERARVLCWVFWQWQGWWMPGRR